MKSFTVHKLDDEASKLLEETARRERRSVNEVAKRLLRRALGLGERPSADHRADFLDLFGTWSEEETAAFDRAIDELERIGPEEW